MKKIDPEDYLCLGAHSIQGVQTGVVVWSPGMITTLSLLYKFLQPVNNSFCSFCLTNSYSSFPDSQQLMSQVSLSATVCLPGRGGRTGKYWARVQDNITYTLFLSKLIHVLQLFR